MRRQDELIALYQGRGRHVQKYLLSQMGRLALAFDSEELLEFLQGQIANPDPVVASQALYSLVEFLPAYVQKRFAIKDSSAGAWTQMLMDPAATRALLQRAERLVANADAMVRAAQLATRPLAEALLAVHQGAEGWTRTAAMVALGQFELKSVRQKLEEELARTPSDLVLARAVRRLSAADGPDAILELVRREGRAHPDLYLLLAGLPTDRALPVLMDAAPATDTVGRMNLAQVLGTLKGAPVLAAYGAIAKTGEGWVIVSLLDAIEQLADPAGMDRIETVYRGVADDFVRVQCVRAAGGLPGDRARAFCLEAARSGSDMVRAGALESLARLAVPAAEVASAATGLLASPQLKARVNAILAVLSPAEAPDHKAFTDLLMSEDALHRLEAAFVLGYLQSPKALDLLSALAMLDPSPSVKQQAAKSLSRYRAAEALPHLLGMVQAGQPRLALVATRALSRYAGQDAEPAVAGITTMLGRVQQPVERMLLYRALGAVAQRARPAAAREALAKGLGESDRRVVAGVLEGWAMVGAAGEAGVTDGLSAIAKGADPRLQSRALMALWTAGETDALERLGALLAAGDEERTGPALECALEIGLLLPEALTDNRFPALVEKYLDRAQAPEVVAEAEDQTLIVPARPEAPPSVAPDDSFEVRRQNVGATPGQPFNDAESMIRSLVGIPLPNLPPEPAPPEDPVNDPEPEPTDYLDDLRKTQPELATPRVTRKTATVKQIEKANRLLDHILDAPAPPPMPPLQPGAPAAPASPAGSLYTPPADTPTMPATPSPLAADPLSMSQGDGAAPGTPRRPRATQRIQQPRRVTTTFRAVQPTPSGPIDRLRTFLGGLTGDRAKSIDASLNAETYLVSDQASGQAAGQPSGQVSAPPARGSSKKLLAGALAGVAALALAAVLLLRGGPATGEGPLFIASVEGGAQNANGKPLSEKAPVTPGDVLKTGPKSVLTLGTPAGNQVVLQSGSSCTFSGVQPGTGSGSLLYSFKDVTGEVAFDFRQSAEIEVRVGQRAVRASRACLTVGRDRKVPSLTVVSGTGYLSHDKSDKTIVLKSGDTIGLE